MAPVRIRSSIGKPVTEPQVVPIEVGVDQDFTAQTRVGIEERACTHLGRIKPNFGTTNSGVRYRSFERARLEPLHAGFESPWRTRTAIWESTRLRREEVQ
jgi:hypothetical protein